MNLETLKLFSDVARLRSFSRGARENEVSQSAASQAIQQLEQELGVALLDRTKRPIGLTPQGEAYFEGCRRLLAEYARVEAEVKRGGSRVAGTVRVAAIYSVGFLDMNRQLQAFRAQYPDARVRVDYLRPNKVVDAVEADEADLGILSYPRKSRAVRVLPLREEPMVFACAPRHPLARRRRLQPSDLEGIPFVAFDADLPIRKAIDRWLRRHRVKVRPVMEFDNIETIKEALIAGDGASILPAPTLEREVRAGVLAALPLPFDGLARPLGIIHRANRRLPPVVARFIETLRERAG